MGQVTIYLEDSIEAKMRAAAKARNLSQSKWLALLVKEKTLDEWPESVVQLAGAWKDFPTVETIRDPGSSDVPREEL